MLQQRLKHFIESGISPEDSSDQRLQKTMLASGSLLMMIATAAWGLLLLLFQEPLVGSISLAYSASVFIALLLGVQRHYRFYRFSQLLLGLLIPFIDSLLLGGFISSGGVILWSLSAPLGGLLLYPPRRAVPWWVAYILVVALSGILQTGIPQGSHLPQGLLILFFVVNIIAVTSIAMFMLLYFVHLKNDILERLRIEERKSEALLLNILPKEIAPILKNEHRIIADQYDCVTILFADLVGFTPLTAEMNPVEMVSLLNLIFSHFDSLIEKYDLEKIRTIGDNYMVASGVPRIRQDHAEAMANMALEMRGYIQKLPAVGERRVEFRIGINSGPVVAGVIGHKKFVYDIWGDAVNIASRMESHGVPGMIQIASSTYEFIKEEFDCTPRGPIPIKGRGEMDTWFLIGKKTTQLFKDTP